MKTFLTILLTAVAAVSATWFLTSRSTPHPETSAESKPLFYQSAMHPWIKSDKPGRCTICGMELTPVYAGEKGFDEAGGENVVALSQSQIQVLKVRTETAKIQPLARTLRVAGTIDDDARRHRIISAYVDGRVEQLFANHHGIDVLGGGPLAMIYSPALLQAEREYRQLDGEMKKSAAFRLQQMGLTPEQIASLPQKDPADLTSLILSPISGTVVFHDVYEGQYVTAGQKLFEIADFSIMWFMFQAYEQDMPWLEVGQKVSVTTPSKPGQTFEGVLAFIDPNFDDATRSTLVRVELPNPLVNGRRELLHRIYADGSVNTNPPAVLSVPRSAVIQTGPDAVVYVDKGEGAYARTPVGIGRRGDTLVEVLSGLRAGDKVVVNGNLLIDGQAEMNRAFAPPETMIDGLTDSSRAAIRDFIQLADAMAAALSADDLAAFNKASEPAMETTTALTESLPGNPNIAALDQAKHFHGFTDLKTARAAFHAFTTAATAVLEPMRPMENFPDMQIWECPMVDEAVPGVPKKARWIQTKGRPGQNPFFGAEMLDCVKEIKP